MTTKLLAGWDLGEETLEILDIDDVKFVEWTWWDINERHIEHYTLDDAIEEFEGMEREDLAEVIREYLSRD